MRNHKVWYLSLIPIIGLYWLPAFVEYVFTPKETFEIQSRFFNWIIPLIISHNTGFFSIMFYFDILPNSL